MYANRFRSSSRWLQLFRLGIAGIALVLLLLAMEGGERPVRVAYAALIGACLVSVLLPLVGRPLADDPRFAALQIAFDSLLVTALVYLTGGVYSFAALLYFGAVLAAALCVSERVSFAVASGATLALAVIQIAYHLAAVEPPIASLPLVGADVLQLHRTRIGRDAAYLIAQCLALHMVAVLGSYLARELQHVRILYGEILEQMAEGLIVVNARNRIAFVNGEARRLLGYRKPEALAGRRLLDVFRRREDRALLECLLQGEPVSVEVDLRTRTGRRAFQMKTTVLRDDRGVVRGTIGIFTDLTLRRQAEEARRAAARLEELTTLSMGIAHEVRNPLASIRGCVQELGGRGARGEDEQRLVDIVCRESDRLDGIVADFMRYARLQPPRMASCDLAALARDTARLLERHEAGCGRLGVALELPAAAVITGDADQLQQVLLNLGLNAAEAMAWQGEVAIRVAPARLVAEVLAGEGAEALGEVEGFEVVLADRGPGLDGASAGRVFVPFFTTKADGTGLGLAVAQRIVRAHGGQIHAADRPGGGAVFTVRLPTRPRGAAVPAAEPEPALASGDDAGTGGR